MKKEGGKLRKRRYVRFSDFYCTECGSKMRLPRIDRQREPGHIKTMWCYKCKEETDFIEVRDRDFILKEVVNI